MLLRRLALAELGRRRGLLRLGKRDVVAREGAVELWHSPDRAPRRRQPLRAVTVIRGRRLPELALRVEDVDRRLALCEQARNLDPRLGAPGHEAHQLEV